MNESSAEWFGEWTPRRLVIATTLVVVVVLAFWCAVSFVSEIALLLLAFVLGTAMKPGVAWLARHGMPSSVAASVLYLLLAVAVAAFVIGMAPLIAEQATAIAADLPALYSILRERLLSSPNRLFLALGQGLPQQVSIPAPSELFSGQSLGWLSRSFLAVGRIGRGPVTIILFFLFAYYWTLESDWLTGAVSVRLSEHGGSTLRGVVDQIEATVGGYVRAQSVLILVVGAMSALGYQVIGLPYALLLGIIAGVAEMVPNLGPALGAAPALLLALATEPQKAMWVLVVASVIQAAENYLLAPRVLGEGVGVSPLVVVFSLIAFTVLFGFPGTLLAVPMAAIIHILVRHVTGSLPDVLASEPSESLRTLRAEVRSFVEDMRELQRDDGYGQMGRALASMGEDLVHLMEGWDGSEVYQ